MAGVYALREVQFNAESTFAENAESPSSNTYATRIPCLSATMTLPQERIRDGGYRSRMNEEGLSNIGPREGGTLELTTYLTGHLATTAGALTETWLQDLLSDGLGGGNTAQVGGTVAGAPTSATQFVITSGTAVAGAVMRLGAKGDARGDAQAGVVNAAATTTFLTAFGATPNAADVVYAEQMAFHDESVAATLGTKRFLVGWSSTPTAGQQYHLMGCQLAGLKLDFSGGGLPKATLSYRFAYWARSAVTIPSASPAVSAHYAAPTAAGSLFINDFGTTTRATLTPANVELAIDLGLEPVMGPGGNGVYQTVTAWQRTKCQPMLTMDFPWSTTYETWWDTANESIAYKHILWTANVINGRSVGFYLPRVMPVGPRPSGVVEVNKQTYVRAQFLGVESTTLTTALPPSAVRIFGACP